MSIEENKATFRRYVEEVWVKGNLDAADEIFAERYLSHPPNAPAEERTPEDVKRSSLASGARPSPTPRTISRT
jgi:hypothetical protein